MTPPGAGVAPAIRKSRQAIAWNDINEPGAYVQIETGDLYRITPESLARGQSPVIHFVSKTNNMFVRLHENPHVPISTLQRLAADNDVQPNFE